MKLEPMHVSCPYCLIGSVEVMAYISQDVVQVPDIKKPRKCPTCSKYVALKPKVSIVGIPLEQARKEGRNVG